jgi:putative redox protein
MNGERRADGPGREGSNADDATSGCAHDRDEGQVVIGGEPKMDISVHYEGGDRYLVEIGWHALTVDQPDTGDTGPTPTDLFVASLASCVAHYAGRFFARHDIDPDGFGVDATFAMAIDRPARVGRIDVKLRLPRGFPDELHERLAAVVEHCTVHNSLTTPPEVGIELRAAATAP